MTAAPVQMTPAAGSASPGKVAGGGAGGGGAGGVGPPAGEGPGGARGATRALAQASSAPHAVRRPGVTASRLKSQRLGLSDRVSSPAGMSVLVTVFISFLSFLVVSALASADDVPFAFGAGALAGLG